MVSQRNSLGFPAQDMDGTWVLEAPEHVSNRLSLLYPVDQVRAEPTELGNLVRLSHEGLVKCKALWRVVAHVPGRFGTVAVLVPTDIPSSVPSSSVQRVERAALGRRFPDQVGKLAA